MDTSQSTVEHLVDDILRSLRTPRRRKNRGVEHGNTTHGRHRTPEHHVWSGMRNRCLNPRHRDYRNYGGRGITVCAEWDDFSTFLHDMGKRPSQKHTLERLDNDGPYRPGNCVWATRPVQARNKRTTRWITFHGVTQCLTDWARQQGLDKSTVCHRLARGWSIERTLTTPATHKKHQ